MYSKQNVNRAILQFHVRHSRSIITLMNTLIKNIYSYSFQDATNRVVSTEQQLKKNVVGEKSSIVLNHGDRGRSQDVPSKYNKPATPKSPKDLEAQFTGAIKSSSINGTSGPSSLNESIIEQNQVSCLVMDPLSIVLTYHEKTKFVLSILV